MDDALYLGFQFGGDSLGDRGIRFCQGVLEHDQCVPFTSWHDQATHVFFQYRGEMIEAVPPRVRRIPFDGRTNVRLYRLPYADSADIWASAEDTVGDWYNFAGFPLALCYCLLHKPNWFLKSPFATVFCSQEATDCTRTRMDALPGVPSVNVTPARLEGWALNTLT